jgi:hypothetical protein
LGVSHERPSARTLARTLAIILDSRDAQGKRKRVWHSFQGTKREAQVRCAQLVAEAQGGGAVDPSKVRLAEFLDRFERDWIALHTSARTAERLTVCLLISLSGL